MGRPRRCPFLAFLLLLLNRQINPAPAFGNWCNLPQFIRRARLVLLPLRQPNPLDFLLGPLLADVGPSTSLPQSYTGVVSPLSTSFSTCHPAGVIRIHRGPWMSPCHSAQPRRPRRRQTSTMWLGISL